MASALSQRSVSPTPPLPTTARQAFRAILEGNFTRLGAATMATEPGGVASSSKNGLLIIIKGDVASFFNGEGTVEFKLTEFKGGSA